MTLPQAALWLLSHASTSPLNDRQGLYALVTCSTHVIVYLNDNPPGGRVQRWGLDARIQQGPQPCLLHTNVPLGGLSGCPAHSTFYTVMSMSICLPTGEDNAVPAKQETRSHILCSQNRCNFHKLIITAQHVGCFLCMSFVT